MIFHPSEATLSRFGDGELSGGRAKRVASHLEGCTTCRAIVARFRELGEAARTAPVPEMRGGVWERMSELRVGGERVILPVEETRAAMPVGRWIAVAAAVVVIAAALAIWPATRGASAGEPGRLTFDPAMPRRGATVTVRYAPIAALADAPRLELRAHYVARAPYDMYNPNASSHLLGPMVATLDRQPDGRFTARLALPDSVIYAVFSVFDPSGEIVDSDHGQLWALGAAGANGRPAFGSLLAAVRSPRTRLASERANAAADSLVSIYPDSAQSWAAQMQAQGSSRIPRWLSVFGSREKRFAKLEAALAKRDTISAGEMKAIATIAALVEDSAAARSWSSRLIAAYPLDPRAIEARYWRALQLPRDSAVARLPVMDSMWNAAPEAHALVAEIGLDVALNAGDSAAIRRWIARDLAVTPAGYLYWGPASLRDPAIRALIVPTLRAHLAELSSDSLGLRPLLSTRSRDKLYRQALAASVLGLLSQAMVLEKRYPAARDTLSVAIRMTEGFCGYAGLHRYRATVNLIMGDTAAAERDLATGAAAKWSPMGPFGDSAAILLGGRYRAAEWTALVDSAVVVEKSCSRKWATP